jgi:hypothetical protein
MYNAVCSILHCKLHISDSEMRHPRCVLNDDVENDCEKTVINTIMRCAQVKVGLINLYKGLFSLNARIYYKLKNGT